MNKKLLVWTVVLLLFAITANAAVNDAVAYYSFDTSDVSGTTLYDISGGTTYNFTCANFVDSGCGTGIGKLGQASYFDGTDDDMDLTLYYPALGATFGLSFWIYVNDTTSYREQPFLFGQNNVITLELDSDFVGYNTNFMNGNHITLNDDTWYHLVFNHYGGDVCDNYVNGALLGGNVSCSANNAASLRDVLGTNNGDSAFFGGMLDEFALYSHQLTGADVSLLYNSGAGYNPYALTDTLNISSTLPVNNTQFNTEINFNVTLDSATDGNCTLNLGEVANETIAFTAGMGVVVKQGLNLTSGLWNYSFFCKNEGGNSSNETSTLTYIYSDIVDPTITVIDFTNNSIIYNDLNFTLNFTDDFELSTYNVSIDGVDIQNGDVNGTSAQVNVSYNASSLTIGQHNLSIRLADGHTAKRLYHKDKWSWTNGLFNDYLKYEWELPYTPGEITIKQKGGSIFDSFSSIEDFDRFRFTFEPNTQATSYTFEVEASNGYKIINAPNTPWKTWLVLNNEHWLDFYIDGTEEVTITPITDTEVEVTVSNLPLQDTYNFNSIGDLNIITETYIFFTANFTETYEPLVQNSTSTTLYLDIAEVSKPGNNYSTLVELDGTNYSATYMTTSNNITSYKYTFTTNAPSLPYNLTHKWYVELTNYTNTPEATQIVYAPNLDNCSTYTTKFLNITVRDFDTDVLISADASYVYSYTSGGVQTNYSGSQDGSTYFEFCIDPVYSNFTTALQFNYEATGYDANIYSTPEIIADNSTNLVTVYLMNSTLTTAITITLADENDNELEGYTTEVYYYDIGLSNYTLVSSKVSNGDGKLQFNLDVSGNKEYQFRVYNPSNELVYTEPKQELIETSYTFRIVLGTSPESIQVKLNQLDYNFSVSKITRNFTLAWNDINDYTSAVRLVISKENVTGSSTLSDQSSSSSSGSLSYNVSDNYGIYYGRFYVTSSDDGNEYIVETLTLDIREEWEVFGVESLFMAFFFIGTMMFLGIAISPELSVGLTILGMIVFWWMGFYAVSLAGVTAICVSFLIIVVRIYRRYN